MPAVTFDLERLDPADGRLLVRGRWSGVRGLRFMRPTLIVEGREVLATLDHKPWAPVEGETWTAAFPWDGDAVDPGSARLAVAPQVTVPLDGQAPAAQASPADRLREQLEDERLRNRRLEREIRHLCDELAAATGDLETRERARETTTAALEAERAARDEALGRRDEALRDRDEARHERDAAMRRESRAAAERDEALAARDAALRELEALRAERDAAVARRDDAARQRDEALLARETLEQRLRSELAGRQRAAEQPPAAPPPAARLTPGDEDDETPLGVRAVPATRAEAPALAGPARAGRWQPTSLDLWVARGLGGAAALCFLLLLLTLLLTLT